MGFKASSCTEDGDAGNANASLVTSMYDMASAKHRHHHATLAKRDRDFLTCGLRGS